MTIDKVTLAITIYGLVLVLWCFIFLLGYYQFWIKKTQLALSCLIKGFQVEPNDWKDSQLVNHVLLFDAECTSDFKESMLQLGLGGGSKSISGITDLELAKEDIYEDSVGSFGLLFSGAFSLPLDLEGLAKRAEPTLSAYKYPTPPSIHLVATLFNRSRDQSLSTDRD
ncbi:hypothetical protein QVD17_02245 [Tagetes erecta]|uniref:Uncharacterized protein n=1 Tax=Tagetes erecta TaxID=13708 RepID=A0AAD8LF71_TARER|nr:hypothetical protein QVD17_02245 [Tagetes erecta]